MTGGILVTCFTAVSMTGGAVKIICNGSVGLSVGLGAGVFVGLGTDVFVDARTGGVFVAWLAGEG